MIKNFRCKESEKLFQRHKGSRFPDEIQKIARRKLLLLDAASDVNDLRIPPGNRLEKLIGDRNGYYSIRINDRWRICFQWKNGDVYEVEITDHYK